MAGIQAKENPGILNWPGEFLQEFHGCTIIGTLSTRRPSRQCWQKFLARTQEKAGCPRRVGRKTIAFVTHPEEHRPCLYLLAILLISVTVLLIFGFVPLFCPARD